MKHLGEVSLLNAEASKWESWHGSPAAPHSQAWESPTIANSAFFQLILWYLALSDSPLLYCGSEMSPQRPMS